MELLIKNYEKLNDRDKPKSAITQTNNKNPLINKNCLDDVNLFYSCVFDQDNNGDLSDSSYSSIYFTESEEEATDDSECSDFDYPSDICNSDVYDLSYDSG